MPTAAPTPGAPADADQLRRRGGRIHEGKARGCQRAPGGGGAASRPGAGTRARSERRVLELASSGRYRVLSLRVRARPPASPMSCGRHIAGTRHVRMRSGAGENCVSVAPATATSEFYSERAGNFDAGRNYSRAGCLPAAGVIGLSWRLSADSTALTVHTLAKTLSRGSLFSPKTSTEHVAWRTTLSAVVPINVPQSFECPVCPITSRSMQASFT